MRLRKLIASKLPGLALSVEVEADESHFDGVRKGRRGRGASGKVAAFWLIKIRWQGIYCYYSKLFSDKQNHITASEISETRLSDMCEISMVLSRTTFTGSSRSVSGVSMEATTGSC
jgi:hypothetical protein